MKKTIRLTESDMVRLVRRVIEEQSNKLSQEQKEDLEWQTKNIAEQLVGKTLRFGKIEGTDNTFIKVVRLKDERETSLRRVQMGGKRFSVYFDVTTKKPGGTWEGVLEVYTEYFDGSISNNNPMVVLYPKDSKGQINFGKSMVPSPPWTWDTVGGEYFWNKVGNILR